MTKWTIPADLAAAQAEADALRARVAELEAALETVIKRVSMIEFGTHDEASDALLDVHDIADAALAANQEDNG